MSEPIVISPRDFLRMKRAEKAKGLLAAKKKPYVYRGDEFHSGFVGESKIFLIRDGQIVLLTDAEAAAWKKCKRRIICSEEQKDDPEQVNQLSDDDRAEAIKAISEDDYQSAVKVATRLNLPLLDKTKPVVFTALSEWLGTHAAEV